MPAWKREFIPTTLARAQGGAGGVDGVFDHYCDEPDQDGVDAGEGTAEGAAKSVYEADAEAEADSLCLSSAGRHHHRLLPLRSICDADRGLLNARVCFV